MSLDKKRAQVPDLSFYKDSPLIKRAERFARDRHRRKKWGVSPYIFHLLEVARLCDLNFEEHKNHLSLSREEIIAAAFLHDIIEDGLATKEEVFTLFGEKILYVVLCLSDEPGATRAERKEKTYPKTYSSKDALFIKLFDRISNVERSSNEGQARHKKMYLSERESFRKALYSEGIFSSIWALLESSFSGRLE